MIAEALVNEGFYVFTSRDYQSLVRGGHNFSVLSFSDQEIWSNESKIDVLVALDENTGKLHKKNLDRRAIIMNGAHENMYFAGQLFKLLGLDFKFLSRKLKELRNFEENLREAKRGYSDEKRKIELSKQKINDLYLMNGSHGISEGAIKSGLDVYYAYPMTPATPVLNVLASKQHINNFFVFEPEGEIAVINMAIGSAITGAKSMIGTSGGGFDLMTEALSEIGQAEVPLVIYLATRPGPSTGVPTYTSQGDLKVARHAGHGEFSRVVMTPGDPKECQELTNQCFYFSQKYKIPCIILSDKHLAESFYTLSKEAEITSSEKSAGLKRYNSYEHTASGEATEDAAIIKKNFERRMKKAREIENEAKKFVQYRVYGNKNSENLVVGWGSTKGAILDALPENCKFLQVLYLEPFSAKICDELKKAKNIIIIENNSTAQLSDLIAEKCLIKIKDENKILRYDGRPFLSDELKKEISRLVR